MAIRSGHRYRRANLTAASPPIVSLQRTCEVCRGSEFEPRFQKDGHRFERCRSCGLERIHPPPSDAELDRIYGQQYYDAWGLAAGEGDVRTLKQATFRRVLAAAGSLPRGAKVLDCGAATGFLMEVAAELGYEPYGVELSAYGAATIGERFGADHVFEGQLEAARFAGAEPGSFAALFMCDYLEHVRDPAAVLRQAARWLAPGAPLVITTPYVGSLTQRAMGAAWTHYKTEHLYYFTPATLYRLLSDAGFSGARHEPSRKTLSLEYIRNQFATYPHPLLTPLVGLLRWLPQSWRQHHIALVLGEMLVVAHRVPPRPA